MNNKNNVDKEKSSNEIEVTILMPCLNEEETIEFCVVEAMNAISASGVNGEVLIADNGSTDGSRSIAQNNGARVVTVKNKGYGNALIGGIKAAKGKYIIMGDADGSYKFGDLPHFLKKLKLGADLVMGCRLPKGGGTIEPGAMPWKHRYIGNPVLSRFGKLFFNAPVDDFHCGLRGFNRKKILDLNLQCTGMEFASEMVVKAVISRLKLEQIPTTLRPDKRSGKPHLRSWRDGWRHLRFLLLYSPKWLFFYPGIVLFTLSMLGFISLLFGQIIIANVIFDINTLLVFSAGILVSFQVIFFAVFTKVYSVQQGLLRPDKNVDKLLNSYPVEVGIIIGIFLFIVGIGILISAVLYWKSIGFGDLPSEYTRRIVISAITAIALGTQTIFSGFALGVFGINKRQLEPMDSNKV